MKFHIEYYQIKEKESPIVLDEIEYGVDKDGNFVIHLKTKNHKYLQIDWGGWTNSLPNGKITKFDNPIIDINASKINPNPKERDIDTGEMVMLIVPETEKEFNFFRGSYFVTAPLKGEYLLGFTKIDYPKRAKKISFKRMLNNHKKRLTAANKQKKVNA